MQQSWKIIKFVDNYIFVSNYGVIYFQLGIFLGWTCRFIISFIPCHTLNEFNLFSSKQFLECNYLLFLKRFIMWFLWTLYCLLSSVFFSRSLTWHNLCNSFFFFHNNDYTTSNLRLMIFFHFGFQVFENSMYIYWLIYFLNKLTERKVDFIQVSLI